MDLKSAVMKAAFSAGILFLTACGGSPTDQVLSTYEAYASAVGSGRGYDATKEVTEETLEHSERLKDIALDGNPDRYPLGIHDETAVYYLRSAFDVTTLEPLTGRDVMNVLVTADLIGERGFRNFETGEVTVSGDRAALALHDQVADASYTLDFVRAGGWKVDPSGFRNQRDDRLEDRIVEFRGNRERVISELLRVHGVENGLTGQLTRPLR